MHLPKSRYGLVQPSRTHDKCIYWFRLCDIPSRGRKSSEFYGRFRSSTTVGTPGLTPPARVYTSISMSLIERSASPLESLTRPQSASLP